MRSCGGGARTRAWVACSSLLKLGGPCLFYDPFNETEVSRTVLADWLTQMATDDPAWTSKTSINQ
jgi:hypothetical protein